MSEYLRLEQEMLRLDALDDAKADEIRDVMDLVWRKLTAEEVQALQSRGVK